MIGSAHGLGDRLVVLIQTFLRGLVVVRRHREDAVGAELLAFAARVRSLRACCSRPRPPAPALLPFGLFDRDLDHAQMLFARQRRAFARGAAGHQKIDAVLDLPAHQTRAACASSSEPSCPERRDQRRSASCKHVPPPLLAVRTEYRRTRENPSCPRPTRPPSPRPARSLPGCAPYAAA